MRRTVVGVIAVVAATSVFSLTSLGMASAATMLANNPPGVAAHSPSSEATALRTLHDSLESQWNAKDAMGMQATQTALAAELAKLQAPQGHAAMSADEVTATKQAQTQNSQLGKELAALRAAHGNSAGDLPLPGLGSLTTLITSLLATLLSIITGLLGGLPVPIPPLPVPVPAAQPVGAPTAG
ncbi:MAG TPA: hypothetical protein VFX16_22270 [Pseudonocardiaceae bacterium]|nr:hypothetical protein [Pseudonocardiaceae bacterium]